MKGEQYETTLARQFADKRCAEVKTYCAISDTALKQTLVLMMQDFYIEILNTQLREKEAARENKL